MNLSELCGKLHASAVINNHTIVHISLWTNLFYAHGGAAERVHEHNIWRLQVPPMFNYSSDQSGLLCAH